MGEAPDADWVGRTLGHFRILDRIGAGGMGEVYLAEDTRLGRRVALKLLAPETARNPERLERFEREARALAALNHPNIVTIHSIEEQGGLSFLAMELVEGQPIGRLIPERGLPLGRFLELAVPLADALAAAHQRGILHRDLKPENVMVTSEHRVKVLDFGLAKLREEPAEAAATEEQRTASVTQDGRILGTVAYMSPEQAQGLAVDHRSDIFSMGILLYQMATGQRPFKGGTNLSVLSSILKDDPVPASDVNPDVPRPLSRMIQRALEKRREDRYQSATDLRKDLEDLKRDVDSGEISSTLSGSRPRLRAPIRARSRLGPALSALGALAAIVAVALIFQDRILPGRARPAADPRLSLAVFYFDNITGDPSLAWLRTGLTDMLVTDLSQTPSLRVLSTTRLYQLLDEIGHREEATTSFEIVEQVARRAEVTLALVGSFVKAGSTIRIQARLQDARSGEVLASERVEGDGEQSLFALVDELTRRIERRLELSAAAGGDRDLEKVTTSSVEAYRHYAEAARLHDRLQEREAAPLFEKAVALDPSFAMALAKLSVVHGNLGDPQKAEQYARRALEHVERLTPPERAYIEGRFYSLDPTTYDKALAAYQAAVDQAPDHMAARNNLAALLSGLRRDPEAIVHLEELRRRGMTFPGTYASLAKAYTATGDFEKAGEVLRDYVEKHPDRAAGYVNLGALLAARGRHEEALEAYARAEALDPGHFEVGMGRWMVYCLTERWPEAQAAARRAWEGADGAVRWQAGWALVVVHLYRGELDAARQLIEEGVRITADNPTLRSQTRVFRAVLLADLGRDAEALAELRRALRDGLDKPGPEAFAHSRVALLLTRMGRAAEARAAVAAAETSVGRLPAPLAEPLRQQLLGEMALARGDAAGARTLLEKALSLEPDQPMEIDSRRPRLWSALAAACRQSGDPSAAARVLTRLAEARMQRLVDPISYVRGLDDLARLHEEAGRREEARRFYERFLGYWRDGQIDRKRVAEAERRLAALGAPSQRPAP